MELIDIAIKNNQRARSRSDERSINRYKEFQQRDRAGSASYLQYDAETGQHRAKTALTGLQISGAYISNAGSAPGDRVAFTRGAGGVFLKAMTR